MPEQVAGRTPDLQVIRDDHLPAVVLLGLPPIYAQGLQAVLRSSTVSCTVAGDLARLPALLADQHPTVIVVPAGAGAVVLSAVASPADAGTTRHAVVVLLDETTPDAFAQALRAGVTGLITPSDALDDVVLVLRCAARGQTVLARELVQALCRPATATAPSLTPDEQAWLRRLAAGGTVAGLARGCGYSERAMYRRLSAVYLNLGARTRTEALLLAERLGLLDERV